MSSVCRSDRSLVRIPPLRKSAVTLLLGAGLALSGCGIQSALNPAFVNTVQGGVVPVTPGPNAAFVLVLGVNESPQTVEFVVTIEREVFQLDDKGVALVDENGNPITQSERTTTNLFTQPNSGANQTGTLFPCSPSPVTLVGLGENLQPTDRHIRVGGTGSIGIPGTGVTIPGLSPLSLAAGNFNCGDTIMYQAFQDTSVAGNVNVLTFLLPGSEQPSDFSGPDTFANLADFIQANLRDEQ